MDPEALRREIEGVEHDVRQAEGRLGDPGWIDRTTALIVKEERARLEALTNRLHQLRARLAERVPFVQGDLASPYVGRWVPLPLYEPADAAGEPAPSEPRAESLSPSPGRTLDVDTREALARRIAEVYLQLRPRERTAALVTVRQRCGGDPATLRLVAAAFTQVHPKLEREVREELTALGRPSPELPRARETRLAPTAGLSQAEELPDVVDGLTRPQRAVLTAMRDLAPPGGPFVASSLVVAEAVERAPAIGATRLDRALVSLCHPLLRRCPLVEGRGITHRRQPGATRVELVRLADFAEAYLDGNLALPLLLINGAEGMGTLFPPSNPRELLDGAIALLEHPRADLRDSVYGSDFPGGGVLHARGPWDLRYHGAAGLRLRAAAEAQADRNTGRGRILISGLPLPLEPAEVARGLEELRAGGLLDGVTSVRDESTAERVEIVLELEHVAFSAPVLRALLASRLLETSFEAELRAWRDTEPVTMSLSSWMGLFLEQQRARVKARLREELERTSARAALAEAVVVALALLEPVLDALRSTCDDEEAVAALTTFLDPAHRAALPPALSHDYERGFTEAQARHLVKQRRLRSRSPEAARHEWAELVAARQQAEATLGSESELDERVRQDLQAARARFGEARRTSVEWWD